MSYTASVGTVTLADLSQEVGTYLKGFSTSPIWDRRSYHIPGTTGSLVCKMGATATVIVIVGKIVSASSGEWFETYRNLATEWSDGNAPFEIIAPDGSKYTRCYIQAESLHISNPIVATGNLNGEVFGEFTVGFINYKDAF
jgi:hypothetical protein